MVLRVRREQALGYRVGAVGLGEGAGVDLLALGVQDTPAGSAPLAFAIRGLSRPAEPDGLALAWTLRGAPHWHRAGDLRALSAALWPSSETDGLAKIAWERSRLSRTGMTIHEAVTTVAETMRKVVTGPTVKGAASAAVTARIPAALSHECRPCRSTHVFESLMRMAALPAGLRLDPDAAKVTLTPVDGWPGLPGEQVGAADLVLNYLRHLGPAAPAEVAGWLSTTRTVLRAVWPDGLVEVDLDGRRAWFPEADVETLRAATTPRVVRLLPPSDPFLQARDRTMLVPEAAARKTLWPALGAPGAVLVDGEIAGAWRARAAGKRRLRITVSPFGGVFPPDRAAISEQAAIVAQVRGIEEVSVEYDE